MESFQSSPEFSMHTSIDTHTHRSCRVLLYQSCFCWDAVRFLIMKFSRKIEFSRSWILIRLIDIILLACFSGWLATAHGRPYKVNLAGVIITSFFVSLPLYLLRKAYKLKAMERSTSLPIVHQRSWTWKQM